MVRTVIREQVLQNPTLSDQFKAVSSPDAFANLAVQLGQERGYQFTVEEVKAAIAQHSASDLLELSDEQLEVIAGGASYACDSQAQVCTQLACG